MLQVPRLHSPHLCWYTPLFLYTDCCIWWSPSSADCSSGCKSPCTACKVCQSLSGIRWWRTRAAGPSPLCGHGLASRNCNGAHVAYQPPLSKNWNQSFITAGSQEGKAPFMSELCEFIFKGNRKLSLQHPTQLAQKKATNRFQQESLQNFPLK